MNIVAPVLPGETLGGKYRVERVLGQGGMGIVVAAKHIDLDERVAIKFLLGKPSSAAVDRFLREARAAVKVKGEHVCRVLDFGRLETGEPYIVMEHLEGTDLARKIAKEGAQEPAAAVGWIIEASDAIAEAHALGIVHRDIKPANVFLAKRRDGSTTAKVLDFGISKLASHAQITGTQTPMGSPSYMSPEQMVSAHDVDARTDIWSLGVTLYELLAGKPPFVADSMVQLSVVVREKEPPPLEGIPDELANVITKCLAKDPTARYESVAALVAELAPFAPEDAKGLVMRHARRDSISGNAAALAITALETRTDAARMKPDVDRGSDASDDSSTTAAQLTDSRPGHAPGTFAPLQSTLAEAKPSAERPRPRWPIFAIAASVIAAIAVGGAALSRSSPPAGSATQEAAPPIAKDARAESVDIPVLASAAPRASTAPTASAIPLSSAEKPRSTLARSNNPSLSAPVVAPAAPLHSAAASAPEPPSSATAPAPRARPEAPKRRELDRDDP